MGHGGHRPSRVWHDLSRYGWRIALVTKAALDTGIDFFARAHKDWPPNGET